VKEESTWKIQAQLDDIKMDLKNRVCALGNGILEVGGYFF
jgi:hypothetical protein